MNSQFLLLIHEYLETVKKYVEQLRRISGQNDVLTARRRGIVPAKGVLDSETTYNFHGIGCRITSASRVIDFDFGEHGRIDGFDAWRLWDFVRNCQSKYGQITSLEMVKKEIGGLSDLGYIKKTDRLPSPHLYVLTEEAEKLLLKMRTDGEESSVQPS